MSTNDEYYEAGDCRLHVSGVNDGGIGADWQVWLNTEVADFDGLCIGSGETRTVAIEAAKGNLATALSTLGRI